MNRHSVSQPKLRRNSGRWRGVRWRCLAVEQTDRYHVLFVMRLYRIRTPCSGKWRKFYHKKQQNKIDANRSYSRLCGAACINIHTPKRTHKHRRPEKALRLFAHVLRLVIQTRKKYPNYTRRMIEFSYSTDALIPTHDKVNSRFAGTLNTCDRAYCAVRCLPDALNTLSPSAHRSSELRV